MKRMSGIRRRAVDCLLQAWGVALVSTTLALPLARAASTPHSVVTEHVSRFVEHQTRGLPGQVSWTVAPLDRKSVV